MSVVYQSSTKHNKEYKVPNYYVNDTAQTSGEHEVHSDGCPYLPYVTSKTDLGHFYSCQPAVAKAKEFYNNVDGCATCSPACHTR